MSEAGPGSPAAAPRSDATPREPPGATDSQPAVSTAEAPHGGLLDAVSALLVPLIPGAFVVVATVLLYQHAVDRQLAVIGQVCESEAGWVQQEIRGELDARATAIERLAAEWSEGGDAWRVKAEDLTRDEPQFRGVLTFDSTLVLRAWVPDEARLLSALDPLDDERRALALRIATGSLGRKAVTVATSPLASGERQVLVCAPVERGGLRIGWLVGVLRLRDVLDQGLARTVQRGFSVGVFDGPTLLHGARADSGGPGVRYAREGAVLRGPLLWRVELWPAEDLARQLESRAPVGVLVVGMLLACFVAVSIHLWRTRRRRGTPP